MRHPTFASRKQTRMLSLALGFEEGASECFHRLESDLVGFGRKNSSRAFRAPIQSYGARDVQSRRSTDARAGTRGASMDTAYRACGCAPDMDDGYRRGATGSPFAGIVPGARSGLLAGRAAAVPLSEPRHPAPCDERRRRGWFRAFCAHTGIAVVIGLEHATPLAGWVISSPAVRVRVRRDGGCTYLPPSRDGSWRVLRLQQGTTGQITAAPKTEIPARPSGSQRARSAARRSCRPFRI